MENEAEKPKIKLDYFKKFKITRSKAFPEFMTLWRSVSGQYSVDGFYKDHVKPRDPSITLRQWKYFIDKLPETIDEHMATALKIAAARPIVGDEDMERKALTNMLKVASFTMDQVVENPAILLTLPLKDRIRFLETAMKSRNARALVKLKEREDNRKQSLFEDLLEGAQYGGVVEENLLEQEPVAMLDEPPVPYMLSEEEINTNEQEEPLRDELPADHQRAAA